MRPIKVYVVIVGAPHNDWAPVLATVDLIEAVETAEKTDDVFARIECYTPERTHSWWRTRERGPHGLYLETWGPWMLEFGGVSAAPANPRSDLASYSRREQLMIAAEVIMEHAKAAKS